MILTTGMWSYLISQCNPLNFSRISLAPSFAGLRQFPEGRGFKQWTGDDSKALMKVYLPAIEGHVPQEVVQAFRAFLEFCYIVRRDVIDSNSIIELRDALERFHKHRHIFKDCGVRWRGFNLPRQHSLIHYERLIRAFGAPNGLCSSITESKHIKAVKEPWRRSNRWEALGQMLITNQRLDKLSAAHVDFTARGMLKGTCLSWILWKLGKLCFIKIIFAETQIDRTCRDHECDTGPHDQCPCSCNGGRPESRRR